MQPARSILFVPANRDRFLTKALTTDADALLLDLEDGVPPTERSAARHALAAWAPRFRRPVWVRVNAANSGLLEDDIEAIAGARDIAGLVVPKVDDRATVADVAARLERARHPLPLIAMIESARGVLATAEIAASPEVVSVCIGTARGGDLQTDLGAGWSIDGPELMYARQHVLLAARAAGIAWPLDGVFAAVADPAGFERDSTLSRRLGYRGRTVVHPSQIEIANRVFAPSTEEIAESRRILDALAAAEVEGRGTTTVEGGLIDAAMARRARSVLELAAVFEARAER